MSTERSKREVDDAIKTVKSSGSSRDKEVVRQYEQLEYTGSGSAQTADRMETQIINASKSL